MNSERSTCYVIAGPNGAGKTTFALQYLPEMTGCRNFINADLIAAGLSPLDPASVQMDAGRLLLREIEENIQKGRDFAFETTLAGHTYARLLKELRAQGWKIVLFYLWIPSAEFSRQRVKQRVADGGHDIPDQAILRRYGRTVANFLNMFSSLCDEAMCYDSSDLTPILVFEQRGQDRVVVDRERYAMILESING